MRVPGYFNKRFQPPAPFIRTTVESKTAGIRRPIHFHIDTGASVTVMLDKDASYLGIDLARVRRAERNISGLGGSVNTYVIEDAALFLRAEHGEVIEEKLRLFIGAHDLSTLSAEEKVLIMRMPSLLGRDIIYRFRLVCDRNLGEVYLER
jgi:hypothetical protein